MKILIACEFSGIVREAFRKKGHDAWSCDLLPTEIPGQHIQVDINGLLDEHWDMIIAFTPCTYNCNSGIRWMYNEDGTVNADRWANLYRESLLFNAIRKSAVKVCMENPIPHHFAVDLIGKYDQIIHPWQFGHGETKSTCLWLKNLPKLKPTNIASGREARVHKMPPSKNRWRERSRTLQGIADAMADQWG